MIAILSGLVLATTCTGPVAAEESDGKIRIGVYDNRAIAVAYVGSKYSLVREKMKEFHAAKDAGDEDRMKALEAWGKQHQRQLHRQGFGRVPVDDLLAHVKDQMADLAKREKLSAITRHCDYYDPAVEVMDVTDQLVALFEPSEKTLRSVRELKNVPPISLDQIEQGYDH